MRFWLFVSTGVIANLWPASSNSICNDSFTYCDEVKTCLPDSCVVEADASGCPPASLSCTADTCLWKTCVGFLSSEYRKGIDKQKCSSGEVFCVKTGKCTRDGECEPENLQSIKCKPDEEYCTQKKKCIPKEPQNITNSDSKKCPQGTAWCLETGRCKPVRNRQRRQVTDVTICPEGTMYCAEFRKCSASCGIAVGDQELDQDDVMSCPVGQIYCISQGICSKECQMGEEETFQEKSCPPGKVYCLESERCIEDKLFSSFTDDGYLNILDDYESEPSCPYGTVYCLETGKCISDDILDSMDIEASYNDVENCPPGTVYCLESGSCQKGHEAEYATDDEDYFDIDDEWTSCPAGKVYCMQTSSCQRSCFDDLDVESESSSCPTGMVFCMETSQCQRSCYSDFDEEEDRGVVNCPEDQVYCMAVQACVNNCDFFENGFEENNSNMECPRGKVYCMEQNQCIYATESCSNSTIDTVEIITCEDGLVNCGGSCSRDCCSGMDEVSGSNVSTCIMSRHCQDNQSCCEGTSRMHCVPHNQTSTMTMLSTDEQLNKTCSMLPDDLPVIQDCPDQVCPLLSVCCNGKCLGFRLPKPSKRPTYGNGSGTGRPGKPGKPINGTNGTRCSKHQMYCNMTQSCQDPLSWNCEAQCGPEQVACADTNYTCVQYDQCKKASERSSVWMFNKPVVLGGRVSKGENLSFLWGSDTDNKKEYVVLWKSAPRGYFWNFNSTVNNTWTQILPNQTITAETVMAVIRQTKAASTGVATLKLLETESQLIRWVVQVVVPQVNPSKLSLNKHGSVFVMKEGENGTIPLNRYLVKTSSNKRSTVQAVSKAYKKLLGMFGTSFLESGRTYIKNMIMLSRSGTTTLGVKIVNRVSRKSDYKNKIYFSTKQNQSWELMTPPSSQILWLDKSPKLMIKPEKNFFGKTSINLEIFSKEWDGTPAKSHKLQIPVKVEFVNDAPEALEVPGDDVPLVPVHTENKGFTAGSLAKLYYMDKDEDSMGIAIIFAQSSKLGKWQFRTESGEWKDIKSSKFYPVPKTMELDQSYRGKVGISQHMKELACKYNNVNITGLRGSECWLDVFRECSQNKLLSPIKSLREMLLLNKKKVCVESETTPFTIDSTTSDLDYTDSTVDYQTSTDFITGPTSGFYTDRSSTDWEQGSSDYTTTGFDQGSTYYTTTAFDQGSTDYTTTGFVEGSTDYTTTGFEQASTDYTTTGFEQGSTDYTTTGFEQGSTDYTTTGFEQSSSERSTGFPGSSSSDFPGSSSTEWVQPSPVFSPEWGPTRPNNQPSSERPENQPSSQRPDNQPTSRRPENPPSSQNPEIQPSSVRPSTKTPRSTEPTSTGPKVETDFGSSVEFGKRKKRMAQEETLPTDSNDCQDSKFNIPGTKDVKVVLIPAQTRIRFQSNDKSKFWDKIQAMSATKLIFTAWDASEGRPFQSLRRRMPYCCQCGKSSSLAQDFTVFYIESTDCTGHSIIAEPKEVDGCGVCGGDSSSCKDCNSVVNGESVLDCGVCYPNAKEARKARDCLGSCQGNVVIKANMTGSTNGKRNKGPSDIQVCVPENQADNFTQCDGVVGSGAWINDCGVCVGGTTGLAQHTGKHKCGGCEDDSKYQGNPCKNCGQEVDNCGVCNKPGSRNWNSCKQNFGDVSVQNFDLLASRYIQFDFSSQLIIPGVILEKPCIMIQENEEVKRKVIFDDSKVGVGVITLGTEDPPLGTFTLYCRLGINNKTVDLYSRRNEMIRIFDSKEIQVTGVQVITDKTRERQVLLNATGLPKDDSALDSLTCFFRKKSTLQGELMKGGFLKNGEVNCGTFKPLGGGVYHFGVLIRPYNKAIKDKRLSTAESVIITQGPKPKSATFSQQFDAITVKFDKNIQGDATCDVIFANLTLELIGGALCEFGTNSLTIKLSENSTINSGDNIIFKPWNNIREHMSDPDYSLEVEGSIRVRNPTQSKKSPSFRLNGPKEVCPDGIFNIKISNVKRFKLASSKITYRLSKKEDAEKQLNYLLSEFSPSKIKDKKKTRSYGVKINSEALEFDKMYNLTVEIEIDSGSIHQSLEFSKPGLSNRIPVVIRGPEFVNPDTSLKLKVDVTMCNQSKDDKKSQNYQYYWDSSIPDLDLSKKSGRSVRIPEGKLQGGKRYNISVLVISSRENLTGSAIHAVSTTRLGPAAITAVDRITVGTSNNIILDATLSLDKDNTGDPLKFEWQCRTMNQQGCFDSNNKRFEENIGNDVLKKSYVKLDPNSLPPDSYNMSVVVSVAGMNSTSSIQVDVVAGRTPTVTLLATKQKYNPNNRITIDAQVSGSAGTCVQWSSVNQEGFVYLDTLSSISKSAEYQCFRRDISVREFALELPAPSNIFKGLKGGVRYKFKLSATHPLLGSAEASLVIETLSPPSPGLIQVDPEKGFGMRTKFNIEAVEFSDEDTPLLYTFGFNNKDEEKIRWFEKDLLEPQVLDKLLPASQNGLDLIVKVCDAYEACTEVKSENTLAVDYTELSPTEIVELSELGSNLAKEGSCLPALSFIHELIQTVNLPTTKDQNKETNQIICKLYSDVFAQCAGRMLTSSDCGSRDEGINLLEFMTSKHCNLELRAINMGLDLMLKVQKLQTQCTKGDVRQAALKVERMGYVLITDAKNSRDPDNLFSDARSKRESSLSSLVNSLVRSFSPQQIEVFLSAAFAGLDALGFNNNDTRVDVENTGAKDVIRQKLRELMETIHDSYMAEMCKGSSAQSEPETVNTDDISISVIKTEMSQGPQEKYYFDSSISDRYGTSSLVLKDSIYKEYSKWDCGRLSADGSELPCVGLCLATAVLQEDIITPSSDSFNVNKPKLVSKIHDIRFLNPVNGADMTSQLQKRRSTIEEPIALQLNIGEMKTTDGYTLRCGMFVNDVWTDQYCETRGITPLGDGTANVNCDCSIPGYVVVYLIKDDKTKQPLLEMKEQFAFNKYIQFRIEESYQDVVGSKVAEFESHLHSQLVNTINTKPENIINLKTWPGSIEVAFNLVAPSNLEAGQQQQAYEQFAQLLADGQLDINDLAGQQMNVPAQCVDNCSKKTAGDAILPLVVAACGMAVALFILVFIICAVCIKKKKTNDKLKPFTGPGSMQPTYRSAQFADSLEGTSTSLRNRAVSGIPEYSPSNFNSRNQTKNSIQLLDEDRPRSQDSWGVPFPASYNEPSQNQISMTQPIPSNVLMAKRMEMLPGTPESNE